jgi:hypothetical protein
MSNYGIKISRDGYDVSDADALLSLSSNYDNLKVKETGTITAHMSAETLAHLDYVTYVEYGVHNLGYVPFYVTYFNGLVNDNYATTDDFIVNDSLVRMPPIAAPSAMVDTEFVSVSVDETVIRLFIGRQAFQTGGGSVYFGAHDIIYNYTVFYNKCNEVVDYT